MSSESLRLRLMPLRPSYDHMIVERIPESLTWVRTYILAGRAKDDSQCGNVLAPVSATATSIATGDIDIEESVADSPAK